MRYLGEYWHTLLYLVFVFGHDLILWSSHIYICSSELNLNPEKEFYEYLLKYYLSQNQNNQIDKFIQQQILKYFTLELDVKYMDVFNKP